MFHFLSILEKHISIDENPNDLATTLNYSIFHKVTYPQNVIDILRKPTLFSVYPAYFFQI